MTESTQACEAVALEKLDDVELAALRFLAGPEIGGVAGEDEFWRLESLAEMTTEKVAATLVALESHGLIERSPEYQKGLVTLWYITDAGREAAGLDLWITKSFERSTCEKGLNIEGLSDWDGFDFIVDGLIRLPDLGGLKIRPDQALHLAALLQHAATLAQTE